MQSLLRRFTLAAVEQAQFSRFLCAAMLTLASAASGQDRASSTLDIYSKSLIEVSKQMEKEWGGLRPSETQEPLDYKHVLVSKDQSVQAEYPETLEGRRFQYLTSTELLARRKAAKKDFAVLIVRPATVEKGRVKVVVSQDWIGIDHGHLLIGVSDWGVVFFRFDCGTGDFKLDEVKLGGI